MKSTTREVSEQIVREYTIYECDIPGCNFTTENKLRADIHYGEAHCLKRRAKVDDTCFFRFDDENDAREYWKWYKAHWKIDAEDISEFNGSGWYYRVEYTMIGRYQCEIYQIGIQPATNELERLLDEQVELRSRYEKIERLLNEE
jgi:hypothetical protein